MSQCHGPGDIFGSRPRGRVCLDVRRVPKAIFVGKKLENVTPVPQGLVGLVDAADVVLQMQLPYHTESVSSSWFSMGRDRDTYHFAENGQSGWGTLSDLVGAPNRRVENLSPVAHFLSLRCWHSLLDLPRHICRARLSLLKHVSKLFVLNTGVFTDLFRRPDLPCSPYLDISGS